MKRILFLTGTRADFGKIKPLIKKIDDASDFEYGIFATGMHTLNRYGFTINEIYKQGFSFENIYVYMNQNHNDPMDLALANTITGLSRYVKEIPYDLIVVHGDRVEALAGAITGVLNNILVAHIEGGEVSGTIDEVLRHSISKLCNIHFVANESAYKRLIQLGEDKSKIYIIGSPDIDVMLSENLPSIKEVKKYYNINFTEYGVILFHPITTEINNIKSYTKNLVQALVESKKNYVVIYPNNDSGSQYILEEYKAISNNKNFKFFPSLRFEYFLTLLKHSKLIIGNSSAGIREAPIYGIYSINIGTRQNNRYSCNSIINVDYSKEKIFNTIKSINNLLSCEPDYHFGKGNSAELFLQVLKGENLWKTNIQKIFQDII